MFFLFNEICNNLNKLMFVRAAREQFERTYNCIAILKTNIFYASYIAYLK